MTMANANPRMPGDRPSRGARARERVLDQPAGEASPAFRSLPPMRYPFLYAGFVLVSSMDLTLTWMVLQHEDGYEVNPIAASVIDHWGLPGAIVFKFSLMLFVIIICEIIGRKRDRTARRLARWSVGISAFPPVYTMTLVGLHLANSPLLGLIGL